MHTKFWSENLNGRGHLQGLGIDGDIILEWIFRELEWEAVERMHLAEDRDQWRALVNTIMNRRIP